MGIDSDVSRFAAAATAKVKKGASHGTHSDECSSLRHFKCRERECCCGCHKTMSEVPRLLPREVEDE